MKTVCIVPIKKNSKRVKGKNFKLINKKPLYTYLLDKLKFCNFDEIYVDSDSKVIEQYTKKNNYKFIYRKASLAKDMANGNDLLNYITTQLQRDITDFTFHLDYWTDGSNFGPCIEIFINGIRDVTIVK